MSRARDEKGRFLPGTADKQRLEQRSRDEKGRFLPGTADKQRLEQRSRDEKGRFSPGNQQRFPPGQSGNPAGRPKKGDAWADLIAEVMECYAGELTGKRGDEKRTIRQAITRRMILNALGGDVKAAQWLADRESGKPGQRLALEDPDGKPLGPIFLPVRESDAKIPDSDGD